MSLPSPSEFLSIEESFINIDDVLPLILISIAAIVTLTLTNVFLKKKGRKVGSCCDDHHFSIGKEYEICYIYPSNSDVELQGDSPEITIRATDSEYGK